MAEKKDEKKAPAKATAAKAAPAKPAAAKKTTAKAAAPAKRAVARPVTRVAPRPAPEKKEREEAPAAAAVAQPKPKAEPRPLPTAPAGQVPLIAGDGNVTSIALPEALATAKVRAGVLYQALEIARSNAHLGTAATKNRSRVKGGGAKPWRQKGTGRARQGSTRAPHWRHGGVVFGPNGRRYQRRIPEKMRREAFAEAFAARVGQGRVLVYEGLSFENDRPRTRAVVDWLGKLGDTGKALFVTAAVDEPTARAAANAREIGVRSVGALRTTDLLTHDTLIVRRDALDALASRVALNGTSSAAEGARTAAGAP